MISNKCYYGLRALMELAIQAGNGPVTIGDIAAARNIPVRFLEAILRQLKQAGLADSSRGKDGGYILARPAASITVGEVVRLFEGSLLAVGPNAGQPEPALDVLEEVWKQGEEAIKGALDRVTLEDLTERERAMDSAEAANYTI